MSLVEADVKAADDSALSELASQELLLVDFIADVISTLFNKKHFKNLVQFMSYHFELLEFSDF